MNKPLAKVILVALANRMGMKTEIFDVNDNGIVFRLISEDFSGISQNSRMHMLEKAFEKHGKVIADKYVLIFEAYTPNEVLNLEPRKP